MADKSKVRETAEVVKGIVEAVPLYQDLAQPMAQEFSQSLVIIAKTVRIALAPLSGFIWGYERISDYLDSRLTEKLRHVPPERIVTPEPEVAVPAIEALRYSRLREQYANLLATAMDANSAHEAHPAFVEILKQLTPDEARLLQLVSKRPREFYRYAKSIADGASVDISASQQTFPLISGYVGHEDAINLYERFTHFSFLGEEANCIYPNDVPTYVVNLCRLGLTEIIPVEGNQSLYKPLEDEYRRLTVESWAVGDENIEFFAQREAIGLTLLGVQFCAACIADLETAEQVIGPERG